MNNNWFDDDYWSESDDWLLGGFLLIDLEYKCARILNTKKCLMTKSDEITIPFFLLGVNSDGMSKEALWNLIERKVKLRFYFQACYMKDISSSNNTNN